MPPSKTKTKGKASAMQKAPIAASRTFENRKPSFKSTSSGTIISHVERFASPILSANKFSATSLYVNAGNSKLFPWLSSVAQNYESYRFRRLSFIYTPRCSTTTPGAISMSLDYDASDQAPTSTLVMDNTDDAVNGATWKEIRLVASKANLNKMKEHFVVFGNQPTDDPRVSHVGLFTIATEYSLGADGTSVLGYLLVDYEIELLTPQLIDGNQTIGNTSYGYASETALPPNAPPIESAFTTNGATIAQPIGPNNLVNAVIATKMIGPNNRQVGGMLIRNPGRYNLLLQTLNLTRFNSTVYPALQGFLNSAVGPRGNAIIDAINTVTPLMTANYRSIQSEAGWSATWDICTQLYEVTISESLTTLYFAPYCPSYVYSPAFPYPGFSGQVSRMVLNMQVQDYAALPSIPRFDMQSEVPWVNSTVISSNSEFEAWSSASFEASSSISYGVSIAKSVGKVTIESTEPCRVTFYSTNGSSPPSGLAGTALSGAYQDVFDVPDDVGNRRVASFTIDALSVIEFAGTDPGTPDTVQVYISSQ